MYFEEILKIAAEYWYSPVSVNQIGKYYLENVDDAWKKLDSKYKYWVELLNWSIGVTLSELSDENSNLKSLCINDLNVNRLERRFNQIDLQGNSWKFERSEYKGFKSIPSQDQLITKEYLNSL
jgi:hypothetical protein